MHELLCATRWVASEAIGERAARYAEQTSVPLFWLRPTLTWLNDWPLFVVVVYLQCMHMQMEAGVRSVPCLRGRRTGRENRCSRGGVLYPMGAASGVSKSEEPDANRCQPYVHTIELSRISI